MTSYYEELITSIKDEEMENSPLKKIASAQPEGKSISTMTKIAEELNLEAQSTKNHISANLEKIASTLDKTNTVDELVKLAEEAGNSDISNLVKIAEALSERIADKVIKTLENRG